MSFYSYKNGSAAHCPCRVASSEVLSGLSEKVCIQVQRVYDSCLWQEHGIRRNPHFVFHDRNPATRARGYIRRHRSEAP